MENIYFFLSDILDILEDMMYNIITERRAGDTL